MCSILNVIKYMKIYLCFLLRKYLKEMPPPKDEKFRKRCPKCKDTDYNNRNFKLMINECGHSLCRHCVDTLFARNSGPCPTCGRTLLKKAFWEQTLDDPMIEKEVYWRKKFKDVFSIREENFPNLRAYNDFLEELEDKILDFVQEDSIDDAKLKRLEASRQEYSHLLLRGGYGNFINQSNDLSQVF